MYEESISFLDVALVTIVICIAAYYLYHKLFKKGSNQCAKGCNSCPSAQKNSPFNKK